MGVGLGVDGKGWEGRRGQGSALCDAERVKGGTIAGHGKARQQTSATCHPPRPAALPIARCGSRPTPRGGGATCQRPTRGGARCWCTQRWVAGGGGGRGRAGLNSGPGLRPPNLCLCECGGAGPRARRCLPPGARPTDLLSCPWGRMASPCYPTLQRRRHSINPTPPHTHCVSSKVQRRRSTAPPTPLPRAQPPGALPGGHPQPGARGPRHPRPPGALKHRR